MKLLKLSLISFLAFTFAGLSAQETTEVKKSETVFTVKGEFRTIGEYRDGYKGILADSVTDQKMNPNTVIRNRARITFESSSDKFDSKFSFQDVRTFGMNNTVENKVPSIYIHEAWGQYKFNDKLGLRIGRQELNYNDGRILSRKDYIDYGVAHDAMVLKCDNKEAKRKIDVGFSATGFDQNFYTSAQLSDKFYKTMGLFFLEQGFGEHKVSAIYLLEERENIGNKLTYARQTFGIIPELAFGDFKANVGFYKQFGSDNKTVTRTNTDGTVTETSNGEKMTGMMYYALFKYDTEKLKAGLGYDMYSGEKYDDDQLDLKNKAFTVSPEMWAVHAHHGLMDYYVAKNAAIGTAQTKFMTRGLTDIHFFGEYGTKTSVMLAGHLLGYAQEDKYVDVKEDGTTADVTYKKVGTEIDFVLSHKFDKGMMFKFGYSVMLPGAELLDNIDQTYEGAGIFGLDAEVEPKMAQWVYFTFSFKPTLFTTKK